MNNDFWFSCKKHRDTYDYVRSIYEPMTCREGDRERMRKYILAIECVCIMPRRNERELVLLFCEGVMLRPSPIIYVHVEKRKTIELAFVLCLVGVKSKAL
jgi:hypothetical protein